MKPDSVLSGVDDSGKLAHGAGVNGGPAFPAKVSRNRETGALQPHQFGNNDFCTEGMTLRDYAAIHSVQPGAGEIVSMAGLVYNVGAVWSDPKTRIASFENWFNDLPLTERLDLFARVKYAMADAMIAARVAASPKPAPGEPGIERTSL